MVKSVTDNHFIRSRQNLHKHHHRKTFAKAVRDHREISYPRTFEAHGRGGDGGHGVGGQGDERRKDLRGDLISEMLKVAATLEMMPPEIKDMVFMTTEETSQDYGKLKQRIFARAGSKTSAQGGMYRWTSAE